jgi:hypothetical protein
MIMRSTCSCPEQQTRSKQLRNKRDNNAFFEGMPESKTFAGRLVTRHDENMDQVVGMALAEFEKMKPTGTARA